MKTNRIRIQKNKNIGKVVYLVEGEKTEIELLKHIYTHVFQYDFVSVKRKGKNGFTFCDHYKCKHHPYSQVFVINTKNSNISSVRSSSEYIDRIYKILYDEYHLEMRDASVYYIFDRDKNSNQLDVIQELMKTFQNSQDNDLEYGGLLLLSYPAIESFIISCFEDVQELKLSPKQYKTYVYQHQYHYKEISEGKLISSIRQMFLGLDIFLPHHSILSSLDHFSEFNLSLLEQEEEYYQMNEVYYTLSLLMMSFIDLGLIEVEELS